MLSYSVVQIDSIVDIISIRAIVVSPRYRWLNPDEYGLIEQINY